jgi:hypothetical protein
MMSTEKPPAEIWTLAQSHDVKLVPTAGLPKYVLAEIVEMLEKANNVVEDQQHKIIERQQKRIAELDHALRESQEQTRVQAVVYEGRERRDKARIAELEAELIRECEAVLELLKACKRRLDYGHSDTCALLVAGPEYKCSCGHDALEAAVAKATGEKGA